MIICPVCKGDLIRFDRTFKCDVGHCFDVAKSGYVNLWLSNSQVSGDNKEMVLARNNFLELGFYQPLCEKLVSLITPGSKVLDMGCGEGFYTRQFASVGGVVVGVDVSKHALMVAAKRDKVGQYVLASVFDVPVKGDVDVIFNVFAPLALDECLRLLGDEGVFIKVDPGPRHLFELKSLLYDTPYLNELSDVPSLELKERVVVEYKMDLCSSELVDLFYMTPYCFKSDILSVKKLQDTSGLSVTAEFVISIYSK